MHEYHKFVCSFIIAMKQNAVYLRNMLIYLMDPHKDGMNDKMVFFFESIKGNYINERFK